MFGTTRIETAEELAQQPMEVLKQYMENAGMSP
jgi:hypothetical protein